MCNLYSITKGPQAIRDFARAMRDTTGNLPPIPGCFLTTSRRLSATRMMANASLQWPAGACRRQSLPLGAMRGPGDSYSDVILRIVGPC
jgi:hypothetical protein